VYGIMCSGSYIITKYTSKPEPQLEKQRTGRNSEGHNDKKI
jgi:hypothetical protein